jgi:signal peptide peptidase SppA
MPEEHEENSLVPAQSGPILMHIAERVLNRPLLMHPAKAEIILHVLEGRLPLGGSGLEPLSPEANRFLGSSTRPDGRERKYRVRDGTAIVPVVGSLVNRGGWIGANSGMTSYEGLSAQLREAESDPDVSSILLDIDSPGGEATGMFAVAEQVRLVGQTKPVTAFVNDMAASAAYGIASAANEIVVSPTSVVGSIGVVMTHMDRSRQMERQGVKPTLIYAGRHKVDGNPFGPLSEDVQADLQAEVSRFYDQFVSLVDRGRAGMTEQAIRATEARTYIGQDAIERGLADRMASLDEVLNDLSSTARGANKRSWFGMSKTIEAAPQAEIAGISPEAHAAAVAAARAEGAVAERARISAILRTDAAAGRLDQALAFALDTELAAEQAVKVLAAAPKATSAIPSIAARAAAEAEFGDADPVAANAKEAAASAVWSKVLSRIN